MNNYITVDFMPGDTIEKAVNTLQDFQSKGILAKGKFNGKTLFSDTVTLDGAYEFITGKSHAECLKEQQQWHENYLKEEREYKNSLPVKIQEWIKKGEEILDADFINEWCRIVPIRADDLYHGMELDASLDIIKSLNDGGTFEDTKKIIDSQGHSGMSHGLVCAMVQVFSKRGAEFVTVLRNKESLTE